MQAKVHDVLEIRPLLWRDGSFEYFRELEFAHYY